MPITYYIIHKNIYDISVFRQNKCGEFNVLVLRFLLILYYYYNTDLVLSTIKKILFRVKKNYIEF